MRSPRGHGLLSILYALLRLILVHGPALMLPLNVRPHSVKEEEKRIEE